MQLRPMKSPDYIQSRVNDLRTLHHQGVVNRALMKAVMAGGRQTVEALFGKDTKLKDEHLPAANLIHSGMQRLGQQLGQVPVVKSEPPPNRHSERARDHAALIGRLVQQYDMTSRIELKTPRIGRWIAGYGFALAHVGPKKDPLTGSWWPHVRIKSSYDVYPGFWSDDEEPDEVAVIRQVDPKWLGDQYPQFKSKWGDVNRSGFQFARRGGIVLGGVVGAQTSNFEGTSTDNVTLIQYLDISGTYLYVEETDQLLDWSPNPLPIKHFTVGRRIDFDGTMGQWDHSFGVLAMQAKLNILGFVAAEDSVFQEVNIVGDPTNTVYKRGRTAVNRFPPGTSIQRGVNNTNLQQTFAQIDRLERQLRIAANYPVSQDGQSPNSFATGQGIDRLASSADRNVKEYQTVMAEMMMSLDTIRLCWDEVMYGGEKKPLEPRVSKESVTATYDPAEIRGRYLTERVYGVMAGWDDNSKIVAGLQLLQGGIIDRRTFQENLDNLRDPESVNDQIAIDRAFDGVMAMLEQRAAQQDPAAAAALIRIYNDPSSRHEVLNELFQAEEQEPDAAALAAAGGGGAPPGMEGPPPDIATVLSQLNSNGRAEGGVQTVGRL